MSFLRTLLYNKFMKVVEDAYLVRWRSELLKDVDGRVLEIGAGTGASLELYPDRATLEIVFSEPDKGMRVQLERKLERSFRLHVKVISSASECIDSPDGIFDYVFVSLVCCSMQDVGKSLSEINRVLKPGGRFIFLEHVAAPEGSVLGKWQNRLNFFWRKIAGNCHLNRETERHIVEAGFTIQNIRRDTIRKAMPLFCPTIRGVATRNCDTSYEDMP